MIRVHPKHVGAMVVWIAVSFALAGCYTVLQHPQVVSKAVPEEGEIQQDQRCTDCHSRVYRHDYYFSDPFYERYRWSYYDPFWMRGPFYSRSSYSRWWYYNAYPWWWDSSYYDYTWYDDPYYVPSKTKSYREKEVVEEKKRTWGRRESFSGGGGGATYSVSPRTGSGTTEEIRDKDTSEARPSSSAAQQPASTQLEKRTKSASPIQSQPVVKESTREEGKDSDTQEEKKGDSDTKEKKKRHFGRR